MNFTINNEGIKLDGVDWKDVPLSKKILFAFVLPIALVIAIIAVIFGVSIALGAVVLALPLVLVGVAIACVVLIIALVIILPIAIMKRKAVITILESETVDDE